MAGTKEVKTEETLAKSTELDPDELVEMTVLGDPSQIGKKIFCSVNGVALMVPCGEPVKIKRKYAEVLKNAHKQSASAARAAAAASEAAEELH